MIQRILDYFASKELWDKVTITLLAGFIVWSVRNPVILCIKRIFKTPPFTTSGIWYSSLASPADRSSSIIELVKIKQTGEQIRLYIEHYKKSGKEALLKYKGSGIHRGGKISAYCYVNSKSYSQNGILALRKQDPDEQHAGTFFSGIYAEYKNDNLSTTHNYVIERLPVSSWHRFKWLFQRKYFNDYNALETYINENCQKKPV